MSNSAGYISPVSSSVGTPGTHVPGKSALENGMLIFVLADMSMFGMFLLCIASKGLPILQFSGLPIAAESDIGNDQYAGATGQFLVGGDGNQSFRHQAPRAAASCMGLALLCGFVFIAKQIL